jgi:flagellar protein FlbT
MALKITLKPGERLIVGGAVVRNGDGRVELIIENEVAVLRESDILRPADVRTPCERIVFSLQLAYVDPSRRGEHLASFRTFVDDVKVAAPSLLPQLAAIQDETNSERYYQALKLSRRLLERERELISNVR